MITINLLLNQRVKHLRLQRNRWVQLIGVGGVFVLVVGGCLLNWWIFENDRRELVLHNREMTVQLESLRTRTEQIEAMESRQGALLEQSRVMDWVKAQQDRPIRLLDLVSQGVDPLDIGLEAFRMEGGNVTIEGKALTRQDIFQFAKFLDKEEFFRTVDIVETRLDPNDLSGLYQFTLHLELFEDLRRGAPTL